jgi:two-component system, NtrC family, sensor kinase
MGERATAVLHSLGFQLLAPLFVTVGVVLAVHALVSFASTKEHFLRLVEADADRSSTLIKRATHDGMLLDRKNEVQAIIRRLAEGPEIATIRVYDKNGFIVMSAAEKEIGQRIALDSETCRSCHPDETARNAAVLERSTVARVGKGREVLRHLSVIANEPSCATAACHAHPTTRRVLGVLDIEMSMAPLDAAIHTSKSQFLWTTLSLVLIVGLVAAVFVRRVVQRPVRQLYDGTRRIAGGDLDSRIQVRGRHELAQLAEAFNQMAQDLSDARRELTAWSEKLEQKVVEKTDELGRAQRQVLHMEKMASLGKLSATVAHELNNPLSGMRTYARLVRREIASQPIDAEIRAELSRYLQLVEMECGRCGGIVQNLLLFARGTGATMAPVDLNEVVERSLMLVRHHLEISRVKLYNEPLRDNAQIVADAGQLQQALVALFVNAVEAIQARDGEEGELSVSARGGPDTVEIDIRDTGVGIPPDVLPQIFDPFFSTKQAENGVGLGLAVVYGIVQRHGGQITVESTVGQGTVFHLRLPRQAKAAEDDAPARSDGPRPNVLPEPSHGKVSDN